MLMVNLNLSSQEIRLQKYILLFSFKNSLIVIKVFEKKYLRCSHKTSAKDIVHLMFTTWKMYHPKLLSN